MNFFRTNHFRLSAWEILFMFACVNVRLQCNLVESAALGRIPDTVQPAQVCQSYCSTPACLEYAVFYLRLINKTVNPCDDFYEFACGNFIQNIQLPDALNSLSLFEVVQSQVLTELFEEIKKEINVNDLDTFKKVKTYYSNCMNESYIKQEGTKPIFKFLNLIGGWPVLLGKDWDESKFDWAESIYKLQENKFPLSFPVQLTVQPDRRDSTTRILKVNNYNTLINKVYFIESLKEKYFKNYYKFITNTALALGAKEAAVEELKDMLDFETNLFKIQTTPEELSKKSIDYLMTVRELSQNYSSIPWLKLFNKMLQPTMTINEDEVVSIIDIDYIAKVEKLLQNTPKRVLSNYLSWKITYNILDHMPVELQKLKSDFNNVLKGTKGIMDRESKCANEVIEIFPVAVSSLYVKKHFSNSDVKKSIYDLVQDIKSQTKRNLEKLDWMDEKTRKAALHKLAEMTVNPGYTDELMSDEKVNSYYKDADVTPGSYLESALNMTCFILKRSYADLRKPINKTDWTLHPSSVTINAYYQVQHNKIEIPAGILREPFFKIDRPNYLNYGAIGTIIGHEITHAFDNTGRKYDEQGNYANWWDSETETRFLNKVQCIVDQYNNFTIKELGLRVNGVLTQGENIADNGGFKAAYHAYNEWVSRNNIYEDCLAFLNYSPRQMFWISAASGWCAKQTPEYLQHKIATSAHSPESARIITSFSNIKEFAEDFNCNVGSPMNPENKCVVW